jgi:hypothetical protein
MKLQKREKILVAAAAGLVVVAGLAVLMVFSDPQSDETLHRDYDALTLDLKKKDSELQRAEEDARQLEDWKRRSLPSNRSIARSLYHAWLTDLCGKAGLQDPDIHSEEAESAFSTYTRIPFTVRARARLDQIVNFLFRFYSAGHLHQIRRLEIKPGPQDFELIVAIEALSLPDAVDKDKLSTVAGHPLRQPAEKDYREAIGGRNFFAAYTPSRTPLGTPPQGGLVISNSGTPPPPPHKVDPAKFAVITAFTQVDGSPRVWLIDQMGGKEWQLGEGEKFRVGGGTGQIGKIDPEGEVNVRYDGTLRSLHVGDHLREDKELKK